MPKSKLNGSVYTKSLPGGDQIWEFNSSTNKVFCKACTVDFNYGNDNIVNESSDPCGRSICADLVGKLNSEEKPIVIDVAEL